MCTQFFSCINFIVHGTTLQVPSCCAQSYPCEGELCHCVVVSFVIPDALVVINESKFLANNL